METLAAAVVAVVFMQVSVAASAASYSDHYLLSRIAFGSCANQSAPQVLNFLYFSILID